MPLCASPRSFLLILYGRSGDAKVRAVSWLSGAYCGFIRKGKGRFCLFLECFCMKTRNELPLVLVLSASDPDGRLGAQSELSALSGLGRKVLVSTIITARIVRQSRDVSVYPVSAGVLRSQLSAALDALRPDVVKISFLPDTSSVCEVVAMLRRYGMQKVIYSPSFTDGRDNFLLTTETLQAITCHLLPVVRLLITRREDGVRLLSECPGVPSNVKKLDDVNFVRCLISTFHCACYLVRPLKNNILAVRREIFFYRSFYGNSVPEETVDPSVSGKRRPAPEETPSTPESPAATPGHILQSFAVTTAAAWAFTDDVKKPLFDARICVESCLQRQRYLNSDYREAPYYPLTDGGNYE